MTIEEVLKKVVDSVNKSDIAGEEEYEDALTDAADTVIDDLPTEVKINLMKSHVSTLTLDEIGEIVYSDMRPDEAREALIGLLTGDNENTDLITLAESILLCVITEMLNKRQTNNVN